jgi:phosphoribosylglycinamide formyltransferase-1
MEPIRVGILASGTGSNFKAIAEACRDGKCLAEVAVLLSDRADAGCLNFAEELGIPAYSISRKNFPSREAFEEAFVANLQEFDVQLVCLAGFMRLVHKPLLDAFPNRILNIHPALLPAFPGLESQKQAFDYGVKVAGCTVHFVDAGMDTGPIIVQEAVPVLDDDTVSDLSARILEKEHIIYARAIDLYARGKLKIRGRKVIVSP